MSNTNGVLLYYTEYQTVWNVCLCITKDILLCLLNVKLLRDVCTSIMKGLLLCYNEYQIVMNRLNEQFKEYYHVIVIS
jgi:hypothetical protein